MESLNLPLQKTVSFKVQKDSTDKFAMELNTPYFRRSMSTAYNSMF